MSATESEELTTIQRFFKDKVILLTGGSGFLGKVIIEKLLRSCPDVGRIYLLLRGKNGFTAEERLATLINTSVFIRLTLERPRFAEKLFVINGDMLKPGVGLSRQDEDVLIDSVHLVIHCAATIRFNERLKVAIETNVTATRQMCMLATRMKNLESFVYVSTAFTNCDGSSKMPEEVCPPPVSPDKLISLAEILDENELDRITPNLIRPKKNTYIFTKCAAENVIFQYRTTLPIAIVRPSIVVAAYKEPSPGWIDNTQGATGTVSAVTSGLMHTMMCKLDAQCNLVPVDKVASAIIALVFALGSQTWQSERNKEGFPVINYVSKSYNCATWRVFRDGIRRTIFQYPSERLFWYPFFVTPESHWAGTFQKLVLHRLIGIIVDFIAAMAGHPTVMSKLYTTLDKYLDVVNYFCTRQFNFEDKKVDELWNLLDPQDQKLFHFNLDSMDWDDYMRVYVYGCRKYLLKEDDSNLEKARYKLKILYGIHLVTVGVGLVIVLGVSCYLLQLCWRTCFNLF